MIAWLNRMRLEMELTRLEREFQQKTAQAAGWRERFEIARQAECVRIKLGYGRLLP